MATPHRIKNRYRLSEIDMVPENYFPMDEILKTRSIHVSAMDSKIMRNNTLRNMVNRMKSEGRDDFMTYWREKVNSPVADKLTADIFPFLKILRLAPVCHLIEIFPQERRKKLNAEHFREIYISFGIRQDLFRLYFETGDIPNVLDDTVIKRTRQQSFVKVGDNSNENRLSVPACPQLRRWRDWCKLAKKNQSVATLEALSDYMEANPVDGLPPVEDYRDRQPVIAESVKTNKAAVRNVKISENVQKQMYAIIYNYNADPATVDPIGIDDYVEQAIVRLNAQMPLKYSAPDIYKERLESEKVV